MSVWNVFFLGQRYSRQAYILANSRMLLSPQAQKLPVNAANRSAHNSLYHMVKKRTLEARSKLQANKYPNNQACLQAKTLPCPDDDIPEDCDMSQPKIISCNQDGARVRGKHTNQKVCENTQVLMASNYDDKCTKEPVIERCRVKRDPCAEFRTKYAKDGDQDDECSGGGGAGDGDGDGKDTKWKCILAILAALGAGGLLAWLLFGGKDKGKDKAATRTGSGSDDELKKAQSAGIITIPPSSADLPKKVPYLLIGGGTAAFSAFRAIKSNDAKAKVLMISNETRKPYMRPPLSKELWYTANENKDNKEKDKGGDDYRFKQWTGAERSLYFEPPEFFVPPEKLEKSANGGLAVAQGFSVKKIDAANRIVTLGDGYEINYEECLIATGCAPKNLFIFRDASPSVREKVMVYRTPDDFDRLRHYAKEKRTITIVGNGFIGSELACSLAHYSKENGGGKIYQVFQESGNMSKVLPKYLSRWTMKKMEALGVSVVPNASIRAAHRDNTQLKLELNNGTTLLSDIVVVCVGCSPNTALAGPSGLEIDRALGGFVVNTELEARRNLYAAGDASCFYDPLLGRRRVEHHDHSVVSGRLAGENMTGKKKPYTHQSMFWSDLGPEIGYEGIGLVDSSLPTVGVFALPSKADRKGDNLVERTQEDAEKDSEKKKELSESQKAANDINCDAGDDENYGKGVIFYLKNGKIVGILLWNLFNRIGLARTIINQDKKYEDLNEVAKLFEIHA